MMIKMKNLFSLPYYELLTITDGGKGGGKGGGGDGKDGGGR